MKNLLIVLLFFPLVSCSQNLCNLPETDNVKIFNTIFSHSHFKSKLEINVRNNFTTSCVRFKKLDVDNVSFLSEKKLYSSLIDDYITFEQINYSGSLVSLIITERKKSLFTSYILKKKNDGDWEVVNYESIQGKLKTDDFLYSSILEKKN